MWGDAQKCPAPQDLGPAKLFSPRSALRHWSRSHASHAPATFRRRSEAARMQLTCRSSGARRRARAAAPLAMRCLASASDPRGTPRFRCTRCRRRPSPARRTRRRCGIVGRSLRRRPRHLECCERPARYEAVSKIVPRSTRRVCCGAVARASKSGAAESQPLCRTSLAASAPHRWSLCGLTS